ncbi:VOC family protein [Paenibacillus mesophilus]|uniref:VOC family protein n=1 Tax=Paenibacillus mesophilus TaxID=2582849 RepID=UPI0013051706|nr:VOC family protein [Paenibacillus mesophilus]
MNEAKRQLSHIGVVFRHVGDLDGMRDFYENVLNMEKLWVAPNGATGFRTGKEPGPTIIVDRKQTSPDRLVAFNFETADVFGFHRKLRAQGVKTDEVRTFEDRSALFHFTDPDGYTLMIWGCNQRDTN